MNTYEKPGGGYACIFEELTKFPRMEHLFVHRTRTSESGNSYKEPRRTLPATPNSQAADSDRNILWNLGPVNCTPTSRPPAATGSVTCTTLPLVENSGS